MLDTSLYIALYSSITTWTGTSTLRASIKRVRAGSFSSQAEVLLSAGAITSLSKTVTSWINWLGGLVQWLGGHWTLWGQWWRGAWGESYSPSSVTPGTLCMRLCLLRGATDQTVSSQCAAGRSALGSHLFLLPLDFIMTIVCNLCAGGLYTGLLSFQLFLIVIYYSVLFFLSVLLLNDP